MSAQKIPRRSLTSTLLRWKQMVWTHQTWRIFICGFESICPYLKSRMKMMQTIFLERLTMTLVDHRKPHVTVIASLTDLRLRPCKRICKWFIRPNAHSIEYQLAPRFLLCPVMAFSKCMSNSIKKYFLGAAIKQRFMRRHYARDGWIDVWDFLQSGHISDYTHSSAPVIINGA